MTEVKLIILSVKYKRKIFSRDFPSCYFGSRTKFVIRFKALTT